MVQFAFWTFHSHRGFSPVTNGLLMKTRNRFNGLPFRYSAIKRETVETVRLMLVAFPPPRAEAAV